jgi:hypothetical protein
MHIQVASLKRDFRKLRQRKIWKDHVVGCAFAIHLVDDDQPDRWHPHLHVVASTIPPVAGAFRDLPLGDHWHEITGDSFVVKVQEVRNVEDEPWRLCNYIFRPVFEPFRGDEAMMKEFVVATKSKPLTGMLGGWRGSCVTAEGDGF